MATSVSHIQVQGSLRFGNSIIALLSPKTAELLDFHIIVLVSDDTFATLGCCLFLREIDSINLLLGGADCDGWFAD